MSYKRISLSRFMYTQILSSKTVSFSQFENLVHVCLRTCSQTVVLGVRGKGSAQDVLVGECEVRESLELNESRYGNILLLNTTRRSM
jgi:hypothetical protein